MFPEFACPTCRNAMTPAGLDALTCENGHRFERRDNIWQMLDADPALEQFMAEYAEIRAAEGRICQPSDYYRQLPFGTKEHGWPVRARTFTRFIEHILPAGGGLHILDVGAGNGWLSYQLARRGHKVVAVDLSTSPADGLGVYPHYDAAFTPVQATFDRLPLANTQFDRVIFNASLHYSTDYLHTLAEARRVLRPGGQLIILDTPFYHDATSGQQMVAEREAAFEERCGFPSNAIPSENYLTYDRLTTLGEAWQLDWPIPRWRWVFRRLRAALTGQREPAQFPIVVGP